MIIRSKEPKIMRPQERVEPSEGIKLLWYNLMILLYGKNVKYIKI